MRKQVFERNTEIIAAFFTNRCYNDIYSIAKDYFARNGGKSLTEVYANLLFAHLHEIEASHSGSDGVIRETIKNLHVYYCEFLGEVALDEFINRIVAQIVPEEFFSSMGMRDCDAILRDIVKQTALSVGKRALKQDMMHRIIDVRSDQVGVGILRDVGISVLHDFKSSLLAKLYAKKSSGADGSRESGCRVIPFELYDKIRTELRKAIESYVELEAKHGRLELAFARTTRENTRLRDVIAATSARPSNSQYHSRGSQYASADHNLTQGYEISGREEFAGDAFSPDAHSSLEHRFDAAAPATTKGSLRDGQNVPGPASTIDQNKNPAASRDAVSPIAQILPRRAEDIAVNCSSSSPVVNRTIVDELATDHHPESPAGHADPEDTSRHDSATLSGTGGTAFSDFHDGGDDEDDACVDVAKLSRDIADRNKLAR